MPSNKKSVSDSAKARSPEVPSSAPAAKPGSRPKAAAAKQPVPKRPVKDKAAAKARKVEADAPLVRDSFTMPEADFALIAALKERTLAAQRSVKKSELLRAGLHALAGLSAKGLIQALDRLEPVKLGRPKKRH